MTGPGIDTEYDQWPGPTYTNCEKCGESTDDYFATICNKCKKGLNTMAPGIDYTFDARQHEPKQAMGGHPVGKFPASIFNTECVENAKKTGGMFVVTFSTPAGQIPQRYNLWNPEPKAVEIAHGQLSALCHATGVYQLSFKDEGAALRNARLMIEVGYQKGHAPDDGPDAKGYTEVKKVYDQNGNEPGKAPAAAPQPAQGGWANTAPAAAPAANAGGWGGAPANPAPAAAPQGWQPGPTTAPATAPTNTEQKPPWAR